MIGDRRQRHINRVADTVIVACFWGLLAFIVAVLALAVWS